MSGFSEALIFAPSFARQSTQGTLSPAKLGENHVGADSDESDRCDSGIGYGFSRITGMGRVVFAW